MNRNQEKIAKDHIKWKRLITIPNIIVVSRSIKKPFLTDYVNIYFFQSIVNYLFFNRFKSVGLPHIAYIVIH